MMNPKEYRQPRCPHGWVDVTQCEPCKTAAERDALQNEIDHLRSALAQQGEPDDYKPEWWPAVENILTEYGLDAISFVADFKKASGDYPAQIKQDISAHRCIGKDPLCPCQDGDACHYEGKDAWPVPQAQPLTEWISVKDALPQKKRGASYMQHSTGVVLVKHSDRPDYPITAHAIVGEGLGVGIAIPTEGAAEYPEIAWYSVGRNLQNPFDLKNQDFDRYLPKIFGSKITHWMPIPPAPNGIGEKQ